jgi:hypothetical protein
MNCVDFFLYNGIVVDFLEMLINFRIFNGFFEILAKSVVTHNKCGVND